ncbi:MAG: NAD(P)-dependent glycerol-3-phosphate dehydrogenase [Candidatus Omnitrophica bacterium]|nr:NAD(P)-dependent glycerol-3-phosphate dehydrogenase [Candidatus Omnitrophota bacterium]
MGEKIGVIGAGGWGITLTRLLRKMGYRIILWEPIKKNLDVLKEKRESPDYFPGFKVPEGVDITGSIREVTLGSDVIIIVVRSTFFRNTIKQLKKFYTGQPLLIGTKGLERDTGNVMSEIIISELGNNIPFGVLSGPTIAREIAEGMPSAAVVATKRKNIGLLFQKILSCETLRIYTNTDIKGAEIGGAFKNVIAIGAGIIDGLGLGINTKAAYLTRGLNEMSRIGCRLGGREKTFRGLSGMGDLITTSFSKFSRNRSFGEAIVKIGKERYLKENKMVIEGLFATEAFYRLSRKMGLELPITQSIYRIIYENTQPEIEIKKLMTRKPKEE